MKTTEQFKKELLEKGVTQKAWAEQHGFNSKDVSMFLNNQSKGRFGKSHAIAVAAGIKAQPEAVN
jgi:gp16 family phage-associated protein